MKTPKGIFIVAAIFSLVGVGWAQEQGVQKPKQEEKRVKLEEIKTYSSKQEYLTDKFKGKPWVNADNDVIKFYDGIGKVRRAIKGRFYRREESLPEGTQHWQYFDIFENHSGGLMEARWASNIPGSSTASWTIYDTEGNEKAHIQDNRMNGYIKKAPNGNCFLLTHWAGEGYGMDGKLVFFDNAGKKIKEQNIFDRGGNDRVIFSDDGSYGVYLLEGMGKGAMAIFDSTGNILAKYEDDDWFPIGPGDIGAGESQTTPHVRISPEAGIVIIGDKKGGLTCFDFSGSKLWTLNYQNSVNLVLSDNGTRLLVFEITRNDSKYTLLDAKTGQLLKSSSIEIYRAPGISGQPEYMEEKPWAYLKSLILGNRAILVYTDARDKRAKIVSGAVIFDFEGNQLAATSWDKPEMVVKDNKKYLIILRNGGVKKWQFAPVK